MASSKMSAHDICLIGIFTAVIAVMSQISIPMPYLVPMTLQTFAIPLTGIILGARRGTIATAVYVLIGAIGLPVFANYNCGISYVFGPTGGFILSFPIMALTAGIGAEKGKKAWLILGLIAGSVINYLCGTLMYSIVMSSSLYASFVACVLPFIPTAIIKVILAAIIGAKCKRILKPYTV